MESWHVIARIVDEEGFCAYTVLAKHSFKIESLHAQSYFFISSEKSLPNNTYIHTCIVYIIYIYIYIYIYNLVL